MTTSLLGLRRYLRQRQVSMPAEITFRWLVVGASTVVAVLLLCMLLPLPGRSLGLIGLPFELRSLDSLKPSSWAVGNDGQEPRANGAPKQNADGQAPAADRAAEEKAQEKTQDHPANAGEPNKPNANADKSDAQNGTPGKKSGDNQSASGDKQSKQQNADQSSNTAKSDTKNNTNNDVQNSSSDTKPANKGDQESNRQASDKPSEAKGNDSPKPSQSQKQSDTQQRENNNSKDLKSENKQVEQRGEQNRNAENQKQDQQQKQDHQQQPNNKQDGDANEQAKPKDTPQKREANPDANRNEAPQSETSPPKQSLAQQLSQWIPQSSSLGKLIQWLTIAALIAFIVFYCLTHPREIAQLFANLKNYLAMLFGRNASSVESPSPEPAVVRTSRRSFSQFANPFSSNLNGWQPAQVVEHTFLALEAWGAEHGRIRDAHQTAEEFARRLCLEHPQLQRLPVEAANMLDRVMFSGWKPNARDLSPLADLWQALALANRA